MKFVVGRPPLGEHTLPKIKLIETYDYLAASLVQVALGELFQRMGVLNPYRVYEGSEWSKVKGVEG